MPFVPHVGAAGVVEAVSESKGDLGLVPAFATDHSGAWWTALEFDSAPKIIARLPFIDRPDHPAPLNVFVVSRAAADAMATEVTTWSLRVTGWSADAARAGNALAEIVAVPDSVAKGAALLISVPAGGDLVHVKDALVKAGVTVRSAALVGSHATRYKVPAKKP